MDRPYGRLDAVFAYLFAAGVIIILMLSLSAFLASAKAQESAECVTPTVFLEDFKAAQDEYTVLKVVLDVNGANADEFARMTGWSGAFVSHVLVVMAFDDRNGMAYPMVYSVLFDENACVVAGAMFPAEALLPMVETFKSKHSA